MKPPYRRDPTLLGTGTRDSGLDRLSEHHEVIVVGAGITGMSTALLLAERGVDVAVIDARRIGSGSTGRSTAKVSVLHGT